MGTHNHCSLHCKQGSPIQTLLFNMYGYSNWCNSPMGMGQGMGYMQGMNWSRPGWNQQCFRPQGMGYMQRGYGGNMGMGGGWC